MASLKELYRRIDSGESWMDLLTLDTGDQCPIYMPNNPRERVGIKIPGCEFVPIGWAFLDNVWYPLGYKVVTQSLQSLGLRKNPNIMTFPVGEWVILADNQTKRDDGDWGGVWTTLRKGSVNTLKRHCISTHGMETRAFLTAIFNPVFANSYRVKSQGVMLLKEL